MRLTFVNNGTCFSFEAFKMTLHPFKGRKSNMLQVHADLVLDAMKDGSKNVVLLTPDGYAMDWDELRFCSKVGKLPEPEYAGVA